MKNLKELNILEISNFMTEQFTAENRHELSITLSYVLQFIQKNKKTETHNIDIFLDNCNINKNIKKIIKENLGNYWNKVIECTNRFSTELLCAYILYSENKDLKTNIAAPKSILKLVSKILDIKENDNVLDLCMGDGDFLIENIDVNMNYTGIDIIPNNISIIRNELITKENSILTENALGFVSNNKFDKLFAHYPFGVTNGINEYRHLLEKEICFNSIQKASSHWLFHTALINNMEKNGKAVAIMINAGTYINTDTAIRKDFVENGYIETIITLPERLFASTTIQINLIVFSFNNTKINLIDASNIYTKGRRSNELTEKNIETIYNLIGSNSDNSIVTELKEFEKNNFIINPALYISTPEIENGVQLGDLAEIITRGANIKADDLDKLVSNEETNIRYVNISNISHGILDYEENIQYLKSLPENFEKYCLKKDTIIISKNGRPYFKSAIVNIENDTLQLLPSSNFFTIKILTDKINPAYIQAFLSSSRGIELLNYFSTGSAMPILTIENLKKIPIPRLSLKNESKIAKKYKDNMDKLITAKHTINTTILENNNLFN